jgi:ABC-type transport system involved in cytochrome bd biosynthesis fused ATPase/permease subunit
LVKEIKDGRIGVSYSDMDGKKLSNIDTEAAANIVKLLQDHKILISNSMKANLTLPDSDEIGYVSILFSFYLYI